MRDLRGTPAAIALLLAVCADASHAQSAKPRVPPGGDPGGVAIAFIGGGVDYTRAEIAARLARDGEGEIIGWDFLDNDRRPFDDCPRRQLTTAGCPSDRGLTIIDKATDSRLVVARASSDMPQSLVQAVSMVAQSPARVVLFAPMGAALDPKFLDEAARRFPALLIVFATAVRAGVQATVPQSPANDTLISVSAGQAGGQAADIIVPVDGLAADLAAAQIAALAGRLIAREPRLDAAAIKRRIVELARRETQPGSAASRPGTISQPDRHFRRD